MKTRHRLATRAQARPLACISVLASAVFVSLAPQAGLAQQSGATAQAQQAIAFNIPAQSLANALNQFSQQSRHQVLFDQQAVTGRNAPAVSGSYSPRQALDLLIAGSGLRVNDSVPGAFTLRLPAPSNSNATGTLPEVVVTAETGYAPGELPAAYAGGQVATGARVGLLGNKDVMETPFSMTGYTAELMANQQSTSVLDALKHEPSVRNVFPDGGAGEYFNMRGFYMQSHELAWNGQYGLVPHNKTSTELLERVEVLRGPGALLNGMSLGGGVGGVINLVPKRAGDEPLTRLTTTVKSDANVTAHLDFGRRFGEDKQWGARVNLLKSDGDGVVDDQKDDRQIAAVALDYRDQRLRAAIDLYSMREKQTGGLPLMTTFASNDIPAAPDGSTNTAQGISGLSRSKALVGSLEYDFNSQWSGFASLGVKRQRGEGALNNALGMNALPSGDYVAVGMYVDNYFDVLSGEAGVRGQFDTGAIGHQITFSVNAAEQESGTLAGRSTWSSNLYVPTAPTLASSPGKAPKSSEITLNSFAMSDTLSFDQGRYQLTLGLRQQRVRTQGFSAAGAVTSSYDESALTPTVALIVRPWRAPVSVYANYIQGLSQGGSVTDATADNYGEVFAPYKSKQVELGVKWDTGRFLNTLSVFQIERPSLIKDSASNRYELNGEQRNRGVEWTTAGEVAEHVRLLGGAARMQAITTKTAGGTLDGKTALGIPRWQANLGAEWDTPWAPGLAVSATGVYTGSSYANTSNTQKLPSWTRFDLGARYSTRVAGKDVALRANVNNVFDRQYWSGVWNGYVAVGAPRTYKLSVQVDF